MSNNQQISKLQLYKTTTFKGLNESNMLSNAFLTQPDDMGALMSFHLGYYYNNILDSLTGLTGAKSQELNNREYKWWLHSQNDKAIEVVENLMDGNGTPGIYGTPFRFRVLERWFEIGNVLVSDNTTLVRVQKVEPANNGGYIITAQMVSPEPTDYIDPTQITPGAKFSIDYTAVAEYSEHGGGTYTTSPFQLLNCTSILRKQYDITGSAASDVMIVELPHPLHPEQKTKLWTTSQEWNAITQFYAEISKNMLYSIYNKNTSNGKTTLLDEKGRPVYMGAGLREQMAPSNVRTYNKLTYKVIQDFLMDLSYTNATWGGETEFLALTGKQGMISFTDAMTDIARNNGFVVYTDNKFIGGSGMDLEFQGQFTSVKMPNGIKLTVANFDPYDDLVRNRTLNPRTQRPVESERFTIINIGKKNGQSNIKKVHKKGRELSMWSVNGSIDPAGVLAKSTSTMRSNGTDGCAVHFLAEIGLQLVDPTSCGELILNVS